MTRIRENLGLLTAASTKTAPITSPRPQIGKVYGIVLDENTPSKADFDRVGGWTGIGTVFYLPYEQSKNIDSIDLKKCKIARPFFANIQDYPLIGELVLLTEGPTAISQLANNLSQKYYIGIVNIWNNNQQNSPSTSPLGKTFSENSDIRPLRAFEGDRIYQGRKGNGIRFGSTVKLKSNINEWSTIGNDGDPITIFVNEYVTTDTNSLAPNIEEINKEMSSIYMTSTQAIPLTPGASIINPINSSLAPSKYINSQLILNSDRVTINSKKDEVLLFAKTNLELNTDNIINLNAGQYIHLNTGKILLGTKSDNTVPDEPVLLGGQTHDLLLEICRTLNRLAYYLSTASVPTSDGGICIDACNQAGTQLFNDVNNLINKLGTIQSDKVFTI
jgi:hypothetical protein